MEGLAEYYSAELAQKIRRGMHESAYKCQSTGGGRLLGYTVDKEKHFQIDPESAQAVKLIFDLYTKGVSNAEICEALNARGFKTLRGEAFNKNSINRIIKNRKYLGEYRYQDVVVKDGMPRIISNDVFALAQREMERRRTRKAPKAPKAEYLLTGKLYCGHCKTPMQGVSGTGKVGRKWYYYYCANTRGKERTCDKKKVSRDKTEQEVVNLTVNFILQEKVLQDLAHKLYNLQVEQDTTNTELEVYEKKLASTKKAISNIVKLVEEGSGTKSLIERLRQLEEEQVIIEGEIVHLKNKAPQLTEQMLVFMLRQFAEPRPDETLRDYHRRIITCFVSEVYLYDSGPLIFFNITGEDGRLQSGDLAALEAQTIRKESYGMEFDQRIISSTNWTLDEHLLFSRRLCRDGAVPGAVKKRR